MVIILCYVLVFSYCTKKPANTAETLEEFPTKSETLWTDKTELFVEFPALVVNKPSRFAAHFTQLKEHLPITEGSLTVNLVKKGKVVATQTVNSPSSPGIFSPTITPIIVFYAY